MIKLTKILSELTNNLRFLNRLEKQAMNVAKIPTTTNITGNKLYHAEIGFPSDIKLPTGVMKLKYSSHAMQQSKSDRYGVINLPESIDFDKAYIFEIEVDSSNKVIKAVCRVEYDDDKDLILVIIPDQKMVKTVWFNKKSDAHRTLNASKYAIPS